MTRKTITLQNVRDFRAKLIHKLRDEPVFSFLDSNADYHKAPLNGPSYQKYDLLVAIGVSDKIQCKAGNAFDQLAVFQNNNLEAWIFGYFGYDLKNELEDLSSNNPDQLGFEDMFFFIPDVVILLKGNNLTIEGNEENIDAWMVRIYDSKVTPTFPPPNNNINLTSRISRAEYLDTVQKLREHIIDGDVYEVSFCQEFYSENAILDPFDTFFNLSKLSPQPFSAFMRIEDQYIMCASMERYLKKEGNKLISQPIKGTIRRGQNTEEDEILKTTLLHDEKERAENVMIVDLVRNDLSRTCKPGSVLVEELFGIYEFPGVYQMISTVTGELLPEYSGLDAIKASFPMGSMTGAPKIMAMDIIEQYEKSKRGVYSGSIGYFDPNSDFDFNVVIRTLIYNASKKYLSLHVGSAITYDSDPAMEYEECKVKIKGILKTLTENLMSK